MKPRPQSAGYQAAGTYAKKIQPHQLARQDKCTLGVIHPIASSKPREKTEKEYDQSIQLVANKAPMNAVFKDRQIQKPIVADNLIKPFLYVQQVVPKRKTEKTVLSHPDVWQPVKTQNSTRKPKKLAGQKEAAARKQQQEMENHHKLSLYDIETHKRDVAERFFTILYDIAPFEAMRKSFWRWAKKDQRLKIDRSNLAVDLNNFKKFIEEYSEGKISPQLCSQFFNCFKRTLNNTIFMKALSYNFQAFRRSKVEVTNILSDKSAKTRFLWLRNYVDDWNRNYPQLNQAVRQMASYENSLRKYFLEVKNSYQNPHVHEVQSLKRQLEQPMVKYDAIKKKQINKLLTKYGQQHEEYKQKLEESYTQFVSVFEELIVQNHNIFFRKKTIMDLMTLLINQTPSITKEAIQAMIRREQESCQQFLKILSSVVAGFLNQKAKLREEKFTLIELANYIHRNHQTPFEIEAVQELVRLIKQQYCLKYQKLLTDFQQFPGDEIIENNLLTVCFEIKCTKILFKNDIWNEILQHINIPVTAYENKFHSLTINKNITFESIKRMLEDIDKNLTVELNKSRQLSKFVSSVSYEQFKQYADILQNVDVTESMPVTKQSRVYAMMPSGQRGSEEKKVKFADMLMTNMSSIRQAVEESDKRDKEEIQAMKDPDYRAKKQQQEFQIKRQIDIKNKAFAISKEVIQKSKNTFEESILYQPKAEEQGLKESFYTSFQPNIGMKTISKSFVVPQPINMNALDARFHQQNFQRVQEKKLKTSKLLYKPTAQEDIHLVGKSVLLSNLPKIAELPQDPLRVSKYLMNTLEKVNEQVEVVINSQKKNPKNIKEGVNSNYYKQQVDLEKRPYKIDCEGTTKYSLVLPVDYYSNVMAHHDKDGNKDKWYLKSHHVQTLTQHPLSKKDNFVKSDYQVNMDNIKPPKSEIDKKTQQNIYRKQVIINELESRISELKQQLSKAKRAPSVGGGRPVSTNIVEDYFKKLTKSKENKDLQQAASEGILFDLRQNQRGLLNNMRDQRLGIEGPPNHKWWEKADKSFVDDYVKNRMLINEEGLPEEYKKHTNYIKDLNNRQLY